VELEGAEARPLVTDAPAEPLLLGHREDGGGVEPSSASLGGDEVPDGH
jgi:hypothetical protein